MPRALVVDDDVPFALGLSKLVEAEGFVASHVGSLRKAREQIAAAPPDVVFLDLELPDGRGLELLEELKASPRIQTVMITGHGDMETAVEALRAGAVHFLPKPLDFAAVKVVLASVGQALRLTEEIGTLRGTLRQLGRVGALVGTAPVVQAMYDMIERVARTSATVLLLGETGTGKEVVAQTIHSLSGRSSHPFVAINCGAVSPTLIESELFGHERGSFTGADRAHRGHFERANGGTLFLDEITEMPADLQVRLLRVLETRTIQRVGGQDPVAIDVRLMAATNREPKDAVASGSLREDLFYRLSVFPIQVPALRDRIDDIDLLAEHFLAGFNAKEGTSKTFSRAALQRLRAHDWPGNVRELRNVVERAFIMSEDTIGLDSVPLGGGGDGAVSSLNLKIGMSLAEAERRMILATLDHCDGDKKAAAAVLGISLKTLYTRLNEYHVK
jgi:DNA-binding NtrC family response regulator